MQLIITDSWMSKSCSFYLEGRKLLIGFLLVLMLFVTLSLGLYHFVLYPYLLKDSRFFSASVQTQAEQTQNERYMRENLNAMAQQLGEMKAKLLQLELLGDRVSSLAGIPVEQKPKALAQGGVLVSARTLSIEELQDTLNNIENLTREQVDWLTVTESHLFDQKIKKMMLPTQAPLPDRPLGSPFGWRIDPFTGHSALHTGQDYQAETGTSILAAAGGVVVTQEYHSGYGNMVEIDHGNDVITRYAHASKVFVRKGDLVKRGQRIAAVGSTGRSTGPHLHFEVLVQGVFQDPKPFLQAEAKGTDLTSTVAALVPKSSKK